MSRVVITNHAADQFVRRFAREMSLGEALAHLSAKARFAARLKARTLLGQEQWAIDGPACVLVIKRDRPSGDAVVVTVLPDPERFRWRLTEGEVEVLREWAERVAELAPARPKGPAHKPPRPPQHPPMPPKSHPAYAAMVAQHEAAQKRYEEKTKRHLDGQGATIGRAKAALGVALRALVAAAAAGDRGAFEALERVQQIDPGYVTEAFLRGIKGGRGPDEGSEAGDGG